MKYDALALSPEDLKLGVDEAIGQFLNIPGDHPKVVAANVERRRVWSRRSCRASGRRGRAGQARDHGRHRPRGPQGPERPRQDLLTVVKPLEEALPGGPRRPGEGHRRPGPARAGAPPSGQGGWRRRIPGFDVVVATSAVRRPARGSRAAQRRQDAARQRRPEGEVRRRRRPLPRRRSRSCGYQRVTLDTQYDGDAAPMQQLIEDEFRETLKDAGRRRELPPPRLRQRRAGRHVRRRRDLQGVPSRTRSQAGQSTKHAQAFEALARTTRSRTRSTTPSA